MASRSDVAPASPGLGPLLAAYRPPAGHFDELLDEGGAPRDAWQAFARHASGLGGEQMAHRRARIARQIHDNGVTYNVHAEPAGASRPWALDVLPMLIAAAEWEPLARGLRQRARLLDAIARDVYGAQGLLADGLLPAALVLAHHGFLRACHGVVPPGGVFLHQVAFDLARGPDGRWRVVGTRAQAPSGAGYALENRLAISRLFPDAFREMRVDILAPFFRTLQETLLAAAPAVGQAPHVVLLTPGPYSETYFEHAYLARYLGFTLVEGGDLAVRDDRVYLKTVTGLERVHAILRRLDDDFCDPLELRADSALGVPGLVQAWRAGQVLVANAFGTGVLESPGLLGFLPPVCERLLGEPLAVPSVATWWCGEAAARERAAPRLADMVIKPAFADRLMEPVMAAELEPAARAEWAGRLRDEPERFVLQARLPLSQAPVWSDGRLASRALMLRVFLVADGRGDYCVMPGGLTRIAGGDGGPVSGQRGGSSKDTWVLSEGPIETFSLLPGRLRPEDIARSHRVVSSRAAENLFWLGRYAERSENCARLLRAVLARLPDSDAFPPGLHGPVVRACHRHGLLATPAAEQAGAERAGPEYAGEPRRLGRDLIAALFDRRRSSGLAFSVEQTVRVAGAVRERLSADNWRLVTQLFQAFEPAARPAGLAEALELVDRAILTLVAVGGLEVQHMTRDDGWRFLGIGRSVERLLSIATTVAEVAASGEAEHPALLEWLLDLADSTITYRARYMRPPEWLAVADLLLFDRRNPRSAAYQLGQLAKHVGLLPGADLGERVAEVARLGAAGEQLAPVGEPDAVGGFLARCEALAERLSDALTHRFFSHVYEPAQSTAVL